MTRRAWRAELRRSVGLRALPATFLASALVLSADRGYWVGDWQATSLHVQFTNLVLAPLSAGLAAYAATRNRRAGVRELVAVSARGPTRAGLLQWGALMVWVGAVYLADVLVAAALTAAEAKTVAPWPSFAMIGFSALAMYTTVAFCVGLVVPRLVVAPLCAVGTFAFVVGLGEGPANLQRLSVFYSALLLSPGEVLRPSLVVGQVVMAALVCLTSWVVTALMLEGWRPVALVLGACFSGSAVLFTAALVVALPSTFVARPGTVPPVCAGTSPRVCVWPEHGKWLPDAVAVSSKLAKSLGGVYQFPPEVYEVGLGPATAGVGPTLSIDRIPVTRVGLVAGLAGGLLPPHATSCVSESPDLLQRYVVAKAWLQLEATGATDARSAVDATALDALRALPLAEQRRWVASTAALVSSCR